MTDCAKIAVAVLASGRSMRFGSDKLMVDLDGRPMGIHIAHTLSDIAFGWCFAVCSKNATLAQHFSAAGFQVIPNEAPEKGQAHSLHLAVKAAEATDATALLVLLADMPFVSAAHIIALVEAADGGIIASTNGLAPMPPALFPRDMWPMLLRTSGDAGARDLLDRAKLVLAPHADLRDIDVPADLPRPTV